jgi:tetratricopeptide (TPR) repeat protein
MSLPGLISSKIKRFKKGRKKLPLLIILSLISDTIYVKKQLDRSDSLYFEGYKDTVFFNEAEEILDALVLDSKVMLDEIFWRKSHLCFERGYSLKKNSEKKTWYERGEKFAKFAIEKNPNNPEAHFWFALNKGSVGKLNGVLNSLFMVDDLKKEAKKVIELDPDHAGAHMLLGEVYKSLPGLFGGNKKKAIEEFKMAIEKDSLHTPSYISLAKTYRDIKEIEEAKETINKLLSLNASRDIRRFELYDKKDAEKLLKEIEKRR